MPPSLRHLGTPLAAATLALAAYGAHRLASVRVALKLPGAATISLSADWREPLAVTSDYRLRFSLDPETSFELQAEVPLAPEPM